MPSVRILNGDASNRTFRITGGEQVGRDPTNAIQVQDPGVSRRHFQFRVEGAQVWLEDLGSSNGTYVNNQRIDRHLLRERDLISVGGIQIQYSVSDHAPLNTSSSSDEISLGSFGRDSNLAHPGAAPAAEDQSVVLKDDVEEEEAPEDYSMDASIVFDPSMLTKGIENPDARAEALQKRLGIMFSIAQALGAVRTLEELCEKIMDELFTVFPQADRGFILIGDTFEALEPIVIRNRDKNAAGKIQMSRSIARKVFAEKQAILSQNAMEDDRFAGGASILNFRILSLASAPMVFQDETYGLFHLDTQDRQRKFTPDDLNLMVGIAAQAATFIKNHKQAEARANLERYFSPDLAQSVASGEIDLKLGGDMKTGTVFFSDIIGFTSMSEALSPTQVVAKINRYMKYMVDIVFKYKGSVDKFIGDCIMAVWGVPIALDHEAVNAVSAAVEMQNALFLFNCELKAEGSTPIYMGIGLNSGSFVAGNMGHERRMEYTVIGDNVNLAQRVESKAGRGMVLITPTTHERCEDRVLACKLAPVELKGKALPVETYCVRGIEEVGGPGQVRTIMTTLPVAIDAWAPDCQRGLLVKVRLAPGSTDALGLIVFEHRPTSAQLRLQFYAPEMPSFEVDFTVEGEVQIQAKHGCCFKGKFNYAGTPLEELFETRLFVSDKGPSDIP
ncbi:MAG: FHA domain-containing protein, partial [Planctomycetes bacterium]|nr:FHA domain-containing protein [Planctomycetota bacterium]